MKISSSIKKIAYFTRQYLSVTTKASILLINEVLSLLHINLMKFSKYQCESFTTAAPSLTVASAPSPQISLHVSFELVDPPVQVHPVSMASARFSMKSSWIFH